MQRRTADATQAARNQQEDDDYEEEKEQQQQQWRRRSPTAAAVAHWAARLTLACQWCWRWRQLGGGGGGSSNLLASSMTGHARQTSRAQLILPRDPASKRASGRANSAHSGESLLALLLGAAGGCCFPVIARITKSACNCTEWFYFWLCSQLAMRLREARKKGATRNE